MTTENSPLYQIVLHCLSISIDTTKKRQREIWDSPESSSSKEGNELHERILRLESAVLSLKHGRYLMALEEVWRATPERTSRFKEALRALFGPRRTLMARLNDSEIIRLHLVNVADRLRELHLSSIKN
jgi:hypothetical protein